MDAVSDFEISILDLDDMDMPVPVNANGVPATRLIAHVQIRSGPLVIDAVVLAFRSAMLRNPVPVMVRSSPPLVQPEVADRLA